MELESLLLAVPGDERVVAQLVDELERIGLIGWAIDGARLSFPGWALARVVADDDQDAVVAEAEDRLSALEPEALTALLAVKWPDVQVGDVEIDGETVVGPACMSSSAELHEIAVSRAKGLGLAFEAEFEELTLAEVRVDDKMLFARSRPISGGELELLEVFTTARGGSVVLWRRDRHLMLAVLRRSKLVELHVWEPQWIEFGVQPHRELSDAALPRRGDAADIAEILGLAPESVLALDALLHRENPPLDELCALLELPPEALRVVNGECAVEDLPGALVRGPDGAGDAMAPSDDDSKWVRWLDEGQRELKWWYLLWCLFVTAMFTSFVVRWSNGGSLFLGCVGAVGAILTVKDVVDRWRSKRPREA